jgi:TRAP-type C4-dicarboxylate transport system permease small subunit
MAILRGSRRLIDAPYRAGSILAALALIASLVLIVVQMLARWTGEAFPGAPEMAGYAMAAAAFLACADALNKAGHIRGSILRNALPPCGRWIVGRWCLAIGAAMAWHVVCFARIFVCWSWTLGRGWSCSPPALWGMPGPVLAACLPENARQGPGR